MSNVEGGFFKILRPKEFFFLFFFENTIESAQKICIVNYFFGNKNVIFSAPHILKCESTTYKSPIAGLGI